MLLPFHSLPHTASFWISLQPSSFEALTANLFYNFLGWLLYPTPVFALANAGLIKPYIQVYSLASVLCPLYAGIRLNRLNLLCRTDDFRVVLFTRPRNHIHKMLQPWLTLRSSTLLCQFIEPVTFAHCGLLFALRNIALGGYLDTSRNI